jgi:hypothetical protein
MEVSCSVQSGVARVRVLALRALVLAGGSPRTEQLRRAVGPMLADLLLTPGRAAEAPTLTKRRAVPIVELQAHPLAVVACCLSPGQVSEGRAVVGQVLATLRAERRVVAAPATLRAGSARAVDSTQKEERKI